MWSCQRILVIWRWHFMWKASSRHSSAASMVHVSQAYRRTGKTSISYTRIFIGNERYRSFQTCCREDMTDDTRAMQCIISAWLPPLENWVLPRYMKLSTFYMGIQECKTAQAVSPVTTCIRQIPVFSMSDPLTSPWTVAIIFVNKAEGF